MEEFLNKLFDKHSEGYGVYDRKQIIQEFTDKYCSKQLLQTAVVGQSEQLPCFLYQDERGIFIGYHGDTEVTDEWNEYLKTR